MRKLTNLLFIVLSLCSCRQINKNASNQDSSTSQDKFSNIQTPNEIGNKENSENKKWFEPETLDTILNFSFRIQLTLKHTDSVFINEYFLDRKPLDSITKQFDNRHLEALAIEKYLLKTNNEFVKRDSKGLYVKLKDGIWKLLPHDEISDESDNTFEHFFKEFGYYSIRVQWGEGNGYKLVNYLDGTVTPIIGRPYFSPDGQYIISVNCDIEAGYSENGFQLFRIKNKQLQHLGEYKPDAWGPISAKWLDNNMVILKNQTVEVKNNDINYIDFYAEIKIKTGS
jgi:hypothetical protein